MSQNVPQQNRIVSRRHHYIPTFYLKQWAMADGRICQFSRPHHRVVSKRKHPEGTGYMDGLYSVEGAPAEIKSYIEDYFLAQTDQLGHDALQYFLNGEVDISHELRSGWTRFVMSLLQRTPQKIEWLLDNWNRGYDASLGTERTVTRALSTMQMLQSVMDLPQTGAKINGMIWNVVTFSDAYFNLLTSDRPVIISNGLRMPESHIIVPIGPQRLFVAGNSEAFVKSLQALNTQTLISSCNNTVARQAHTYVYGEDDSQTRFVENRLGRGKPQLIVSDIKPATVSP
jgi:hypothetical protein